MHKDVEQDAEQDRWSDLSSVGVSTQPLTHVRDTRSTTQPEAHNLPGFVVIILCVLLLLLGSSIVTIVLYNMRS